MHLYNKTAICRNASNISGTGFLGEEISLISVSSYARCIYWCLKCIYSLQSLVDLRYMQASGAWNCTVQRVLIVVTHSKKIKYWQRLPTKLSRIIQGQKEQKKLKQEYKNYNDRRLYQILIDCSEAEGGTVEKFKSRRICPFFSSKWLIFHARYVPRGSQWRRSDFLSTPVLLIWTDLFQHEQTGLEFGLIMSKKGTHKTFLNMSGSYRTLDIPAGLSPIMFKSVFNVIR